MLLLEDVVAVVGRVSGMKRAAVAGKPCFEALQPVSGHVRHDKSGFNRLSFGNSAITKGIC
jgi:hypothetical protein